MRPSRLRSKKKQSGLVSDLELFTLTEFISLIHMCYFDEFRKPLVSEINVLLQVPV